MILQKLQTSKKQLMGQLAISSENNEHMMLTSGKSYLVFNRVYSLDTIREKLDKITAQQLREAANEILNPGNLNTLIFE